jgi:hypothetical protein
VKHKSRHSYDEATGNWVFFASRLQGEATCRARATLACSPTAAPHQGGPLVLAVLPISPLLAASSVGCCHFSAAQCTLSPATAVAAAARPRVDCAIWPRYHPDEAGLWSRWRLPQRLCARKFLPGSAPGKRSGGMPRPARCFPPTRAHLAAPPHRCCLSDARQ